MLYLTIFQVFNRSLRCARDERKWTILISEPLNVQRFRTSKTAPPGLLGQADYERLPEI